jgi:hypothetical protein
MKKMALRFQRVASLMLSRGACRSSVHDRAIRSARNSILIVARRSSSPAQFKPSLSLSERRSMGVITPGELEKRIERIKVR